MNLAGFPELARTLENQATGSGLFRVVAYFGESSEDVCFEEAAAEKFKR